MKILLYTTTYNASDREEAHQNITGAVQKYDAQLETISLDLLTEDAAFSGKEDNIKSFKKLLKRMRTVDVIFFEASNSDASLGYFLGRAASINKPIVVFHRGDTEPEILSIIEETNDKLIVVRYYDDAELHKEVPRAIDFVSDAQDTRFNFFLSPALSHYLDWISKTRKMPRSVFLRKLIDADIERNEEYGA
jgi:hypothetical protein